MPDMPGMSEMPDVDGIPPPWNEESTAGAGHWSPCLSVSVQWTDKHGDEHRDSVTLHKDIETAQLFPQVLNFFMLTSISYFCEFYPFISVGYIVTPLCSRGILIDRAVH